MYFLFNHTAHKDLWEWLGSNPCAYKSDWPGWEMNGGPYTESPRLCFACLSAGDVCAMCPLQWPEGKNCQQDGIFTMWETETLPHVRVALAAQIRDLPIREDWEGEII